MFDVVCVGLSSIDVIIYPVDEQVFTRDLSPVSKIVLAQGGDAANQAIILSRLGNRTALLARRGDDELGRTMMNMLKDQGVGVDLSGIAVDHEVGTNVCAVLIRSDGRRNFCGYKGANTTFCLDDIDLSILKRTKMVSIAGMFQLPSFDGNGMAIFLRSAKEQGVITVADTNADTRGLGLRGVGECLENTDYFFPSYDEASAVAAKHNRRESPEFF